MKTDLLHAYRQAIYQIDEPFFRLTIGQHHRAWDAWLEGHHHTEWAILTAWNPGSILISEAENASRQQLLHREIEGGGFSFLSGRNVDPAGRWPEEPTLVILDCPLETVADLARRFGQLAFVWGQVGDRAMLGVVV